MTDSLPGGRQGEEPRLPSRVPYLLRLRPDLAERLAMVEACAGWSRNHVINQVIADALPALEAAHGIATP